MDYEFILNYILQRKSNMQTFSLKKRIVYYFFNRCKSFCVELWNDIKILIKTCIYYHKVWQMWNLVKSFCNLHYFEHYRIRNKDIWRMKFDTTSFCCNDFKTKIKVTFKQFNVYQRLKMTLFDDCWWIPWILIKEINYSTKDLIKIFGIELISNAFKSY